MMSKPLVKVCCITSISEAKSALKSGADLLGLVSEMPSGPGVISLSKISDIVTALPAKTRTVLLTSKLRAQDILKQHEQTQTWGLQIVDRLPKSELVLLRKALPDTQLIQVIHVHDKSSLQEALGYAALVDMLLLDSGNPFAKTKTLGGTGLTHDWEISRLICQQSTIPVLLAGGLNPENIEAAIHTVQPDGVDLCSGVRSDGNLDNSMLESFMNRLHTFPD